jgi:leader peptidase (prepilin peptidase)/N-methyltransferase
MTTPDEAALAQLLGWPPFGLTAAGLWGLIWGSFGNVCIYRVPRGLSVARPASHCPACQQPVAWFDNIPVVSYLVLRGRCRRCQAAISPRYPLFELLVAGLALLVYARFVLGEPGPPAQLVARFLVYFFFSGMLAVVAVIDYEHWIVPDRITYPAIPVLFVIGRLLGDVTWLDAAIGTVAGYLVLRAVADGYEWLTGREGLGYGDAKLMAAIGALLGWRALPLTIMCGSCLGSLVSIPILLWQRRSGRPPSADGLPVDPQAENGPSLAKTAVPFGPFLAAGGLIYLLCVHGRDLDGVLLRLLHVLGLETD